MLFTQATKVVSASWKWLVGWLNEMHTAAPSVTEVCFHLGKHVWSNVLSLWETATWESCCHFKAPAGVSRHSLSPPVCLARDRVSSRGYNHSFIQPRAVAIWPDQRKHISPSIRTVRLSSSTTGPQTSTFGDFVWNTELQIAEKNSIGDSSKSYIYYS